MHRGGGFLLAVLGGILMGRFRLRTKKAARSAREQAIVKSPLDSSPLGRKQLSAPVAGVLLGLMMGTSWPQEVELARPTPQQYAWHEQERILFVCLDPCTWQGREYDDHSTPLSQINPAQLDTNQWCHAAKLWGAKEILFVAKHTGGFCWWRTDTTKYGIKDAAWKGGKEDVLAELSTSCREHGLSLGVYVYPGDDTWGAPIGSGGRTKDPSKQEAYNQVFRRQLTEVLTLYGKIAEVWFDGSCVIDVKDILERHAADAVIFQGPQATIRWPGTESGKLPYPAWNSLKRQDLATGVATAAHGNPDGDAWAPLEADTPLYDHNWFWSADNEKKRKSLDELMDVYCKSAGRGGVLLLNSTPNTSGLIPEGDLKLYEALGKEIERRFSRPVAEVKDQRGASVELALPRPALVNHVVLMEDYREGERIREYVVEGSSDGQWIELSRGTSVGRKKIDRFRPAQVGRVRLRVTRFAAEPIVRSLAVFHIEGVSAGSLTTGRPTTASAFHSPPYVPPMANGDAFIGLQPGLGSLPFLGQGRTRSISAENPTGEKGKGGMAIPDPTEPKPAASARAADNLGQGWKVRPFIRLNARETAVLMDVPGPGIIQHIWLVEGLNRGLVIRFYWDGEEAPSVEAPAPDFFAVGHGRFAPVNSLAVVVNPANALNCFWPMPFRTRARITLCNETAQDVELVAYQITYVETEVPAAAGTFHAQYRRAPTAERNPYVILDGVKGRGRYVGTFLAWTQMEKGWFGEGEIKFYMDGDDRFPTICGTGTEDYFLGSYGFSRPYTTAYSGTVLPASDGAEPPSFWSLYRWHVQDPINFEQDLRVTIQALGWGPDGQYKKLSDDIASVAYWYQAEPHAQFPKLPAAAERLRDARRPPMRIPGALECESLEIVGRAPGIVTEAQELSGIGHGWSGDAQLFVQAKKAGDFLEVAIPAKEPGARRILLHATRAQDYGTLRFAVNGKADGVTFDGYADKPAPTGPIQLGVHEPKDGKFVLRAEVVGTNAASTGSKYFFGLDAVLLEKP